MNDLHVVTLTQGKFAIVDAAVAPMVSGYKWCASENRNNWYAVTARPRGSGSPTKIRMHRLIASPPAGLVVDHINHNTLDNRTANLRPCTQSENKRNHGSKRAHSRNPYIGVDYIDENRTWRARVRRNGKDIHIGCFPTAEDAARARDRAAIRLHGEFASLNFPKERVVHG